MKRHTIYIAILIIFGACTSNIPETVEAEMQYLPDQVDYNFHVKPILSDRCFACHGPDAQKREADLRLDEAESAYAALSSGGGHAIVPGSVNKSVLVERILSEEADFRMPPLESNLSLNDREKALLIRWIEQGAEYKSHWAFIKPEKPEVPEIGGQWAKNEIDQFVAAKLSKASIEPSPEADREQLIRRLFFDITGLPPSLKDLDKWLSYKTDDYYEELVNSLLNVPAFGERMAAHWLDVSRFADSEGYLDDFHHTFWPYRDWVIEAYNKNLPYDDFILWQVGGDQMPDASSEQILATAFNRNHKQNSEGGIIPEEFRVEYVADRTNTVGTAFMGLTVGCARCHDHKYDPFSQENYYQLFGFFNSTVERGDGIFAYNAVEKGDRIPNELAMNSGPVLPLPDKEVAAIRKFLLEEIKEKETVLVKHAKDNTSAFENWKKTQRNTSILKQIVDKSTLNYLTFDDMANGQASDWVKGNKPARYGGSIDVTEGKFGKAIKSNASGKFVADGKRAIFERSDPFTISFWIKTPKLFDRAHVVYNGNDRIQGYRGWDVVLDSNQVHFRLNHAHPYQSLDIYTPEPLPIDEWVHFVWTYDGSSKAEGMSLYQNGQAIKPRIARNYLYRSTKAYLDKRASVYAHYQGIVIGNRHYDQDFTDGLLDELRVLNKEADALVALYLFDKEKGETAFRNALDSDGNDLDQFYDLFIDSNLKAERIALKELRNREVRTIDTVQEIMVMGDMEQDRPTFILERGLYDAQGKPVEKNVPNSILPWQKELPKNRYGLGQWLIHPDNPLTARVAVNQMWYLIFGRGIVETVEDLGNQGALPTHPELLDWLAIDFMENGWDVKRLIKKMVTSATYRQSSRITPELQEKDPDNKLLARGMRYRRSSEMIRDNVLATSGLLNDRVGGTSTFPYQPPGLWKEAMTHGFFPEYEVDYEEGLYRRSIYTFWKRLMPPPSMLIFDAADRSECQVRRQRSNTPLQALVLLNDPQIIEGCRVLAEKMWQQSGGNIADITNNVFRLLTSRAPSASEQQLLIQQYEEELEYFNENEEEVRKYLAVGHYTSKAEFLKPEIAALARVNNTILNTTEAYYKN